MLLGLKPAATLHKFVFDNKRSRLFSAKSVLSLKTNLAGVDLTGFWL